MQLTQKQWKKVQKDSKKEYGKMLGKRPSAWSVSKSLPNDNPINPLTTMAFVLLLFAMAFSVMKVLDPVVAFVQSYEDVQQLPSFVQSMFLWVGVILAALVVSTGLTFTILQAGSESTQKALVRYPFSTKKGMVWGNFFRIEALIPRMWSLLSFAVIFWLIDISAQGDGSWYMKYLPVAFEVVLAKVVSIIINKNSARNMLVQEAYNAQALVWDEKFADSHTDAYLTILFQRLREALTPTSRSILGKFAYKSESVDEDAVFVEYMRLTAGVTFAKRVVDAQVSKGEVAIEVKKAAKVVKSTAQGELAQRTPPNDEEFWSVGSLKHDFSLRGMATDTKYNEAALNKDYASGHRHRSAFRQGAKNYFNGHKEG